MELRAQDLKDVIFAGTVVNNNSPGKDGKVQVRVPHVFRGVNDADLPWAIPDRMSGPAGTGVAGSATCMIPANGSRVFVFFQNGNPYDPIYSSDILNTDFFASTVFGLEYPLAWGFSDGQNYIKINRDTGSIKIHSSTGSDLELTAAGDLVGTIAKDVNLTINGNTTVNTVDYTLNITGSYTTNITGAGNYAFNMLGAGTHTTLVNGAVLLQGGSTITHNAVGAYTVTGNPVNVP